MEKTFVMQSADDLRKLGLKEKEAITQVDASGVSFTRSTDLSGLFSQCPNLEKVILSDTILHAGGILRVSGGYTIEELNEISHFEYRTSGPGPAAITVERASKVTERKCHVSFSEATHEERLKHLGLAAQQVEITLVPHKPTAK